MIKLSSILSNAYIVFENQERIIFYVNNNIN